MTSVVMRRPATYEDLLKVPEHLVAEIVDGELYTAPRPAMRHARASSVLGGELLRRFDRGDGGPGGWWLVDEPELHLGRDVLVPDIAGWRRETMPALPDAAWCDIAPDWICEVVSPATTGFDRAKKLPRYARNTVAHAWVVDPKAKTLEVYERRGDVFALVDAFTGNERVRAVPFDACELDLASLWLADEAQP